ncbi:MAG TPA: hypothetical protein VE819_10675, partial [Steroidobacteraceae bacterium]|nr:hypothetical protein [Steroidobacteraceae bacterium]
RSWTETGIAASPHVACREICESADEIQRLRLALIKAWDCVNELRRAAQNLEHSLAAAINHSPPAQDLGPGSASLEVALHRGSRSN